MISTYEDSVLAAATDDGYLTEPQLIRLLRQHQIHLAEYLTAEDTPESPYTATAVLSWLGY